MVELIIIISIILFLIALVLLRQSCSLRKPAEINCVLFEQTELEVELEPTVAHKIGNALRYVLYVFGLFIKKIYHKIRSIFDKIRGKFFKKPSEIRRFGVFDRYLDRSDRLFPSFNRWLMELKRDIRASRPTGILAGPGYCPPREAVYLIGGLLIPKRAYVNDSCIIELTLIPELADLTDKPPKLSILKAEDGSVFLRAEWNSHWKLLEIKLTGVGVDVKPIEPEVQSGQSAFFCWGCSFIHSGLQALVFNINIHYHHGKYTSRIIHRVKVGQVDHLTTRQVRVLAGVVAFLGVIGTVVGILNTIGVIGVP